MQEVTITKKLLIEFANDYMLSPCTQIENPFKVKGPHILLCAWFNQLYHAPNGASDMLSIAFGGWLAARCEFCLMDELQVVHEFMDVLLELNNEVIDVQRIYYDKS